MFDDALKTVGVDDGPAVAVGLNSRLSSSDNNDRVRRIDGDFCTDRS